MENQFDVLIVGAGAMGCAIARELSRYTLRIGVLEKEADEEGYVEIDEEKLARHLAQKAKKEDMGQFEAEDLLFVVQAWLDYEMREEE